jgi:hypothetical protein
MYRIIRAGVKENALEQEGYRFEPVPRYLVLAIDKKDTVLDLSLDILFLPLTSNLSLPLCANPLVKQSKA